MLRPTRRRGRVPPASHGAPAAVTGPVRVTLEAARERGRAMHDAAVAKGSAAVRKWNERCPPGTRVKIGGVVTTTWCWAGLGPKAQAVVWLNDRAELVPVAQLEVLDG